MTNALLLFVLIAVVTGILMAGYLGIYALWRLSKRLVSKDSESYWDEELDLPLADPLSENDTDPKWSDRVDRAFYNLVHRPGVSWTVSQALGWVAFGGVLGGGLLWLWQGEAWSAMLGLMVGMSISLAVFYVLQRRFRQKMQNQLPDVLFLLARSLRSGLSLEQGIESVAHYGEKPLAREFQRSHEQIKLGLAVPTALRSTARRVKLPDFDVFVTMVALHRNLGGNLTRLLDRVAITTRDRNLFRGQFRAATALSRVTTIGLAAGAPVIFLCYTLWQPELVGRFFEGPNGIRMLLFAIGLEIVGIVWVTYLLRNRD